MTLNLYTYVGNNPLVRIDPTGNFWETIVDAISIGWSAYDLWKDPSWGNAGFLAWDIAAAFLPFVPGSYTVKGIKAVDAGNKRIYTSLNKSEALQLRKADPNFINNALHDFRTIEKHYGNQKIVVTKSSMKHILERHHYSYWGGDAKAANTFFDPSMSVDDIIGVLHKALDASRKQIIDYQGGMKQWITEVDGVKYQIGLDNGRLGQFHPVIE